MEDFENLKPWPMVSVEGIRDAGACSGGVEYAETLDTGSGEFELTPKYLRRYFEWKNLGEDSLTDKMTQWLESAAWLLDEVSYDTSCTNQTIEEWVQGFLEEFRGKSIPKEAHKCVKCGATGSDEDGFFSDPTDEYTGDELCEDCLGSLQYCGGCGQHWHEEDYEGFSNMPSVSDDILELYLEYSGNGAGSGVWSEAETALDETIQLQFSEDAEAQDYPCGGCFEPDKKAAFTSAILGNPELFLRLLNEGHKWAPDEAGAFDGKVPAVVYMSPAQGWLVDTLQGVPATSGWVLEWKEHEIDVSS